MSAMDYHQSLSSDHATNTTRSEGNFYNVPYSHSVMMLVGLQVVMNLEAWRG
jgi:hypothetical protein